MKKSGTFSYLLISFLLCVLCTSFLEPLRYLKYGLPLVPCILYLTLTNKSILSQRKEFNYFISFTIFYLALIVFLLVQNIFYSNLSERFLPNTIFIFITAAFISSLLHSLRKKILNNMYCLYFTLMS
jgi:hypothetical protein